MCCDRRANARPHQLQTGSKRNSCDYHFQLLRGHSLRQHASDNDSGNPTSEKFQQNWSADRTKRPMHGASNDGENEPKDNVRAHNLRRRHFGIIQEQNRPKRAG